MGSLGLVGKMIMVIVYSTIVTIPSLFPYLIILLWALGIVMLTSILKVVWGYCGLNLLWSKHYRTPIFILKVSG